MQGTLVSETKCLACSTITTREEAFYDLSLDIEQNCSVTACLKNFRWGPDTSDTIRHSAATQALCADNFMERLTYGLSSSAKEHGCTSFFQV